MLPMILFVPVMYANRYPKAELDHHLTTMMVAVLIGIASWLSFGNVEAFHLVSHQLFNLAQPLDINLVVQMAFYLYAVIMFTGTVLQRLNWQFFAGFVPLWTLLVYAPLANLIWSPHGLLNQLGALDFSGGLVVHLSAGITSLILAALVRNQPVDDALDHPYLDYVATLFILTGWLGFNLAPAGSFRHLGPLIIVNTLTAVLGATCGWLILANRNKLRITDMSNGIICGLVTSTALVGYVSTSAILLVALVSGVVCHWSCNLLAGSSNLYDPVDSFAINGVGGLIGTIGLTLFASLNINPQGASGLIAGNLQFTVAELTAILTTITITVVGTLISYGLIKSISVLVPQSRKDEVF